MAYLAGCAHRVQRRQMPDGAAKVRKDVPSQREQVSAFCCVFASEQVLPCLGATELVMPVASFQVGKATVSKSETLVNGFRGKLLQISVRMSNMKLMTNALGMKIQQTIDDLDLSTRKAADRCQVKHGTFVNVLYGRTKRPDEDVLLAISEGLGLSYRELALAAYGVITDSPAPKEAVVVG